MKTLNLQDKTPSWLASVLACASLLASGPNFAQTVPNSAVTYAGTTSLGVTEPVPAGTNKLTLGYGNILVSSSTAWGGAIYDYAVEGSGDLVNKHDAGRLWQSMVNIHTAEPGSCEPYVNPTEAGDRYNRGSVVVQAVNAGNVQTTKSQPLQYLGQPCEKDLGGTAPWSGNVAIEFNGMTIGKQITLAVNADNNVAQYMTKIYSNGTANHVSGNAPILYLPGNFTVFSTYNAENGRWDPMAVTPQTENVEWTGFGTPTSRCGGIMAENRERTTGVALYGCVPNFHNGSVRHFAFSHRSKPDTEQPDTNPFANDTTALMAQVQYRDWLALPVGETSLPTYIVVCRSTPTALAGVACVNSMANLFAAGY